MRGRIDESRHKIWVLTRLNRWALTAFIAIFVFGWLVAGGMWGPSPIRRTTTDSDATWYQFSALISATIAKRTLAMGPFILRETERSGDLDWD